MPQKGITKYGHIHGGKVSVVVPMGADEVLRAKSGRFLVNDASGRGEIAGDGSLTIMGFAESGDLTCSSSEGDEGGTKVNCIIDITAIFRIPLFYDNSSYSVNYSVSLYGTKHDLVLKNQIQYANLTDNDEETIIIVGGLAATAATVDGAVADTVYGDGYVDVMMNLVNMFTASS